MIEKHCGNPFPHEGHGWKWRQEQFRWEVMECPGSDGPGFMGCSCDAYDGDHESSCAIYLRPDLPPEPKVSGGLITSDRLEPKPAENGPSGSLDGTAKPSENAHYPTNEEQA